MSPRHPGPRAPAARPQTSGGRRPPDAQSARRPTDAQSARKSVDRQGGRGPVDRQGGRGSVTQGQGTERVVGLGAAHAVLRARPQDVLNIAHARTARSELKDLLREAARHRIAYREVESDELERIADTVHHEGICLLVKQRAEPRVTDLARAVAQEGVLLALDRVENPHNVGALLRSAAYFGVRGLLMVSPRERALTPAVVRVAEGGAEAVPVCLVQSLAPALTQLRDEGCAIIGADAHRGEAIGSFRFPARSVIVLGSERHGLASDVAQCCTHLINIPGTDAVESLNVSVAAGILLAFATRRGARSS